MRLEFETVAPIAAAGTGVLAGFISNRREGERQEIRQHARKHLQEISRTPPEFVPSSILVPHMQTLSDRLATVIQLEGTRNSFTQWSLEAEGQLSPTLPTYKVKAEVAGRRTKRKVTVEIMYPDNDTHLKLDLTPERALFQGTAGGAWEFNSQTENREEMKGLVRSSGTTGRLLLKALPEKS